MSTSLNVAVGPNAMTFAGSGIVAGNGGSFPLVGPQYSIPAQVPLNGPGLMTLGVPGQSYTVKFNVGDIPGLPDQFRACWDFNVAGDVRTSCTHHLRSDGTAVGADAIQRVSGNTYVHETNDQSEFPRRIHSCQWAWRSQGPGYDERGEEYWHSIFEFQRPFLYKDRGLALELKPQSDFNFRRTVDLGNGRSEEYVGTPRSATYFTIQGNVVQQYKYSFGMSGYSSTITCTDSNY